MAIQSIKINNKSYSIQATTNLIASIVKQSDKLNDTLTIAVSAAVAHAGLYSNLNPLIDLFSNYRLKSGKLNKQGRLLKAYTLTYYKALAFDANDKPTFKLVATPVEGEEKGKTTMQPISVNSRGFYVTGRKGQNGKAERLRFDDTATPYAGLPHFAAWLEEEEAKAPKQEAKASVSGLKRRLSALADMLDGFGESVEPATFKEIQDAANAIYKRVQQLTVKTDVDPEQSALYPLGPDSDKSADNLLNTPIDGKKGPKNHQSAGRKVA